MVNKPEDVWKKIHKGSFSECWEWMGGLHKSGYGLMRIYSKKCYVHRIVYELTYIPIPEGLFVLHSCDNPKCCNPEHLRLGTHQDNMDDKVKRKRQYHPFGEKCGIHKLEKEDVLKIRKLYFEKNYSQRKLGKIYGVCKSTIGQIIRDETWRNI